MNKLRKSELGFTMFELVIVIVAILILLTILFTLYQIK